MSGVEMQGTLRGSEPAATLATPLNFRAPPDSRSHFPSSLFLGLVSNPASTPMADHIPATAPKPINAVVSPLGQSSAGPMPRVRLLDIMPYEGAPCEAYVKAVDALSGSLSRHNAVVIELEGEDSTIIRCALESTRMYLRARNQGVDSLRKSTQGVYHYRAGRAVEDGDLSPPCMREAFKCMGKAARAILSAVARNLRLRSNMFNDLLDDYPLPPSEVSSSVLVATFTQNLPSNGKGLKASGKPGKKEVEDGLLALIASDSPGIQVYDSNGRWYQADGDSAPGNLLLITGRTLSHATAGLRPAASYRTLVDSWSTITHRGRASLTFRLMPRSNAVLDSSPLSAAAHAMPTMEGQQDFRREPSLRSLLSDPISGAFLEDAVVVSCGHSFGTDMLKTVIETARCNLCGSEIKPGVLIPNYAVRAAATALKNMDSGLFFPDSAIRKRRREKPVKNIISPDRPNEENREVAADRNDIKQWKAVGGVFTVNDRVVIKGNRRTPERFVGKEAIIASPCSGGWYLVKIMESGESIRLQYSSLCKASAPEESNKTQSIPLIESGGG